MRVTTRDKVLAGLAGIALLAALAGPARPQPPDPPAAGRPQGLHSIDAQDVYVRVSPKSYSLGTLNKGERFYVLHVEPAAPGRGPAAFGYAYGRVNRYGWVPLENLGRRVDGKHPEPPAAEGPEKGTEQRFLGSGAASRNYMLKHYASSVIDYEKAQDHREKNPKKRPTGAEVVVTKAAKIYQNIGKPGGVGETGLKVEKGDVVRWRYVTKLKYGGEHYVMVNFEPTPRDRENDDDRWGYIRRDALPDELPFAVK